jgi:hypothetical protein
MSRIPGYQERQPGIWDMASSGIFGANSTVPPISAQGDFMLFTMEREFIANLHSIVLGAVRIMDYLYGLVYQSGGDSSNTLSKGIS